MHSMQGIQGLHPAPLLGPPAHHRQHLARGDTPEPHTLLSGSWGEAQRGHLPAWEWGGTLCFLNISAPGLPEPRTRLSGPRLVHTQKYIISDPWLQDRQARGGGGEEAHLGVAAAACALALCSPGTCHWVKKCGSPLCCPVAPLAGPLPSLLSGFISQGVQLCTCPGVRV